MEVGNDEGTLLKLQQTTEAQELPSVLQKVTKTSRRKYKFKTMSENESSLKKIQMQGEPTSQEVEERADTIPLSNSGKEVCPGCLSLINTNQDSPQRRYIQAPNLETFTTMAVQTIAQSKKQREQEEADEGATTSSGVILTPIEREDDVLDVTASDCDDAVATTLAQPTGCEEAQSNDDTTVVTRDAVG